MEPWRSLRRSPIIVPISNRGSRRGHLPAIWLGVLLASAPGCRLGKAGVQAGGATARQALRSVDPTGTFEEIGERTAAWVAVRTRVEQINVEGFNRAVDQLAEMIAKLSDRLDEMSPDRIALQHHALLATLAALRAQVDDADMAAVSASIVQAADALTAQIAALDIAGYNGVANEARGAIQALSAAATGLEEKINRTVERTDGLVADARASVQSISTDQLNSSMGELSEAAAEVRKAATSLPGLMARVERTLQSLRYMSQVATAVLCLFGACGVVWLMGFWRGRAGRVST